MRRMRRAVLAGMAAILAFTATASAAGPGRTSLLSRPDGFGALIPAGDNAAFSSSRALSGDGRFVVFTSGADDLGVRDARFHVWIRDMATGTTTLLDRGPGGVPGDADASDPRISRDGSTVCFISSATNLIAGVGPAAGETFNRGRVYVLRLSTTAISVADRASGVEGELGDRGAGHCELDADGSKVAFDSDSRNLVANDTNGNGDVFVRDVPGATTQRVSLTGAGNQASGGGFVSSISGTGTRIAFGTGESLTAGDTNMSSDVYVRDTNAGTTFLASVGTGSVTGDGGSFGGSLSDDGTVIAFLSDATNLELGGDTNGNTDAYARLFGADTTFLVSRASGGAGAVSNGRTTDVTISGDGLGVAFASTATNLGVTPPATSQSMLYVRRLSGATTEVVSRASGNGLLDDRSAGSPSLGSAPTTVAWTSEQTFGATSFLNSPFDSAFGRGDFEQVFRRELTGGKPTQLVSRPTDPGPRNSGVNDSEVRADSVSADGRFTVFTSRSDGLVPGVADRVAQAYVRDNVLGTTTLVSRAAGDGPPAQFAVLPGAVISADGSRVGFITAAPNLVQGVSGTNIFVRTLATGELRVGSRGDGPEGGTLTGSTLEFGRAGPSLSADGMRVAFATRAKLTADDTDTAQDVFVRDLAAGTTTRVSVEPAGAPPSASPMLEPSIDAAGTHVAFTSTSTLLVDGGPTNGGDHVFVRDLTARTTVVVDRKDDGTGFGVISTLPRLSAAGDRVAFKSLAALTNEPLPSGSGGIYVRDVAAGRTFLASRADGAAGAAAPVPFDPGAALSDDGRIVTFAAFGLPGAPDDEHPQVFRRDLAAGTTALVSAPDGSADALPASSGTFSAVSADGRCISFTARGAGLATPDHASADFAQVYLRRLGSACPDIPPSAVPDPGTPAATAADQQAPTLTKASLSRSRFAVGSGVTARSARRAPVGTSIRFTVSEGATVQIAVARRAAGRRSGKRCVKPTAKLRRRARCVRVVGVVTLTRRVAAGRRSVPFSGRFSQRRALKPGAHQVTLRATDAAGNASAAKVLRLTIVRR